MISQPQEGLIATTLVLKNSIMARMETTAPILDKKYSGSTKGISGFLITLYVNNTSSKIDSAKKTVKPFASRKKFNMILFEIIND